MKKIFLIIAAVTIIANYVNAQGNAYNFRDEIQFGLKAGFNISNVYDSQGGDFVADPRMGFAIGGFLSIHVWKYFGVQPGLIFSQKGFRAKGLLLDSPYNFTRNSNYIDMPLVATFKPTRLLTLLAGPQISFLINQRDSFKSGNLTVNQQLEFNNSDVRRSVLGLLAGVDINLDPMVLGARAGWDIQNNNGALTPTNPRYKNVWYQVSIGFIFN
jgi:hypothetical protein